MNRIALIGAGQLGSRHLQGLATLTGVELHVVEPSEDARRVARARAAEVQAAAISPEIKFHNDLSSVPQELQVAIVATTSERRYGAMSDLLRRARVKYLVLEKVLFQQFGEYEKAAQLIKRHAVTAWVNCPRRTYGLYEEVKRWLGAEPALSVEVSGGEWGLGCNGIHFFDLFHFLVGEAPSRVDASGLDADCIPARRQGFVEYTGTLKAIQGGRQLTLTALRNSVRKHLLCIRGEQLSVIIDETGGVLWRCPQQGPSELQKFRLPLQSEATGELVREILEHGRCRLPGYTESAQLHLAFLKALAAHSASRIGDACLVT